MLGSSDFADSETTHEIPQIVQLRNDGFLEAAMVTEDKLSVKLAGQSSFQAHLLAVPVVPLTLIGTKCPQY